MLPSQRLLLGTVKDIPDLAEEHAMKPPSTVVFGEVVRVLHHGEGGLIDSSSRKNTEARARPSAERYPKSVQEGMDIPLDCNATQGTLQFH